MENRPATDNPLPSLDSLQHKIDEVRAHEAAGKHHESAETVNTKQQNLTAQLAGGIAAGAAVGCGLGYLADLGLNTSPIGLIIGFFIGFAAGLYNLMREIKKDAD